VNSYLAAAIYIASGARSMERGTLSTDRDQAGDEVLADLELARLAIPRRVYTVSHIEYVVDRLSWLYRNRALVKGLTFVSEPPVLRFFFGRLQADRGLGRATGGRVPGGVRPGDVRRPAAPGRQENAFISRN
jgi:tryptophanase